MSKGFDPAKAQSSDSNSVMMLMGQMMSLPFMALVYSFEIFVRTLQGMQRMTDEGLNTLTGVIAQNSNEMPGSGNESQTAGIGADRNQQTTHEEENLMWDDQDLSGDDLKYVSYSILFTKRDLEATLEEQKQDLVNYSTNGGSYGGLRLAKFFKKLANTGVPRPEVWKENNYPDSNANDTHWTIPEEDEKYITFIYKVDRRLNRHEADYDKQNLDALKGIRASIDSVGAKIGP